MSDASSDLARLLLKEEVEDFLYREAELLDERRYEEWLDLFTPISAGAAAAGVVCRICTFETM